MTEVNKQLTYKVPAKMELACPYCGHSLPNSQAACCGEVGHAVEVTELETI